MNFHESKLSGKVRFDSCSFQMLNKNDKL